MKTRYSVARIDDDGRFVSYEGTFEKKEVAEREAVEVYKISRRRQVKVVEMTPVVVSDELVDALTDACMEEYVPDNDAVETYLWGLATQMAMKLWWHDDPQHPVLFPRLKYGDPKVEEARNVIRAAIREIVTIILKDAIVPKGDKYGKS